MKKFMLVLSVILLVGLSFANAIPSTIRNYESSVDYSCNVDADCVTKDVGNCCGSYQKCTNKDAIVNRTLVSNLCSMEGRVSVCEFSDISSCKCVNHTCEGVTNIGCKKLYWFDNENKECGQKEFCGVYAYQGLQTFNSQEQCKKALNECVCTDDVKTCPDGTIVGRECPKCEFASCVNTYCDSMEANVCYKNLSNGRKAEVKIMPETASQRAIERLGELGFNVTLKEVGNDKIAYELSAEKEGRILGVFKAKGKIRAEVDAETGVIKIHKPWWAFLATDI